MNPAGQLLSAFSIISFTILVPPFIWHIKSCNIPAAVLTFWLLFSTLDGFITQFLWSGEDFGTGYDGKGYCDVVSKLKIGASPGKLCAITALSMQLFFILKVNNSLFMNNKSTKKMVFDLIICLFTPIFVMATNYAVQTSRFIIIKYEGCATVLDDSTATLLLMSIWNLIWAIIALVFAISTITIFLLRRRDVKNILKCTNSGLSFRRFARLLIFSTLIILVLAPLATYYFSDDAKKFHGKYNFDRVHGPNWELIFFYDAGTGFLYDKWIDIGLSFINFLLFGLGSDALDMYKIILIKLKFNRIFNISDPTIMESFPLQSRTATNETKRSQATEGTKISGSTVTDGIDIMYDKVMNGNDEVSPQSWDSETSKETKINSNTMDLEKGTDISDFLDINELDSNEELEYIMNMTKDNPTRPSKDGKDEFNFQFEAKKH